MTFVPLKHYSHGTCFIIMECVNNIITCDFVYFLNHERLHKRNYNSLFWKLWLILSLSSRTSSKKTFTEDIYTVIIYVALLRQMRLNPNFNLQMQTYIKMLYEAWLSVDPAESPACRSKQKILIYTRLTIGAKIWSSKQYIIMVGIQWLPPSSTDHNALCGVERVGLKHRLTWVLTMDPTLREGPSGGKYDILTLIIITAIYNVLAALQYMPGISKDAHSTSHQSKWEKNERQKRFTSNSNS